MNSVHPRKPDYYFLCFFLLLFLSLTFPGSAHALFGGKIDEFTADQVELSAEGEILNTLKLYITPNAVRMDGIPGAGMNPNMPKTDLSMFTFKDKDEHYIFNHDKKIFYQTTLDDKELAMGIKEYQDAQQVKILGSEKVSGYKCEKKEISTSTTIFGMKQTHTMIIWESDRFEMPLRTQSKDGQRSEIRNIDKGSPAKSVFKLPKGYKKVDNIMMAMGMDFKSMGDDSNIEPASSQEKTTTSHDDPNTDPNDDSVSNQTQTTSSNKKDEPFKLPEVNKETIEKSIQNLGDKLKKFKFGK